MSSGSGWAIRVGLAALAFGLCACGDDPKNPPPKFRLEGSLGQVMDVGYDLARILIAPDDISLLFVRIKPLTGDTADGGSGNMQGTSEEYPLKVAYRLLGEPAPAGGRVDLAALDMNGNQRGVLSRNVSNDPRKVLPPIIRGTISFDRPLERDAVISGDFHVTFENGIEAASGRTVFSTYTARVQP